MRRLPRWAWVSGSASLAALVALFAFVAWPSSSPAPVPGIAGMGVADVAQSIPVTASPSITSSAVRSRPPTPTPTATPSAASTSVPAGMRAVTLVNATSQTVWGAATQDSKHPIATTGWVLKPGQSATVAVPSSWGGRFWGRTGCTFDGAGKGHCATGDCGNKFQCTGSGATPATLAEFALAAWGGMDFYDVSNVDGANLPMYINISHSTTKDPLNANGCGANGCVRPITCPAQMQLSSGACQNPCAAFGGDTYCCRGAWAGRTNCIPSKWPVDYTKVFKTAMPYGYSYAFDDSATMACKGGCGYRITFGVSA